MKLVIAEKPSVAKEISKSFGAFENFNEYTKGNNYIVTCLENVNTVISKEKISSISVAVGSNDYFIVETKVSNMQNSLELNAVLCKKWINELKDRYKDDSVDRKCAYFHQTENMIQIKSSDTIMGFVL